MRTLANFAPHFISLIGKIGHFQKGLHSFQYHVQLALQSTSDARKQSFMLNMQLLNLRKRRRKRRKKKKKKGTIKTSQQNTTKMKSSKANFVT